MDHSYFKDRISAYYDRDLPPYELQAVEEHLKECAECQALLAEFEKLDRMVAEKSELADDDYWEQSAQKIEKALGFEETTEVGDIRSKSWSGLGWKIATVAASLAVITFIGLHQGDILKDQTPSPPAIQLESPPLDDYDATDLPEKKMESVTDSTLLPDRAGDTDIVERSGAPVQRPESVVVEKARTSVPSVVQDIAEEAGEKGMRDTPGDLAETKVISKRDMISRWPAEDSAAQQPPAEEMQAITTLFAPDESEAALSKEKADRGLALSEAVDVGAAGAAELPTLRQQRDSLMALYQANLDSGADMEVGKMVVAADKRTKAAKAAASDSTMHLFERELVDVHYRIARLTEDKNEREASTRFLRAYADRTDVPYVDRARKYIDSLISADQ